MGSEEESQYEEWGSYTFVSHSSDLFCADVCIGALLCDCCAEFGKGRMKWDKVPRTGKDELQSV